MGFADQDKPFPSLEEENVNNFSQLTPDKANKGGKSRIRSGKRVG